LKDEGRPIAAAKVAAAEELEPGAEAADGTSERRDLLSLDDKGRLAEGEWHFANQNCGAVTVDDDRLGAGFRERTTAQPRLRSAVGAVAALTAAPLESRGRSSGHTDEAHDGAVLWKAAAFRAAGGVLRRRGHEGRRRLEGRPAENFESPLRLAAAEAHVPLRQLQRRVSAQLDVQG